MLFKTCIFSLLISFAIRGPAIRNTYNANCVYLFSVLLN